MDGEGNIVMGEEITRFRSPKDASMRALPESVLEELRRAKQLVVEALERRIAELQVELRAEKTALQTLDHLASELVEVAADEGEGDDSGRDGGGGKLAEPLLQMVAKSPGISRETLIANLQRQVGSPRRSIATTIWRLRNENRLVEVDNTLYSYADAVSYGLLTEEQDEEHGVSLTATRSGYDNYEAPKFEDDDDLPF